MAFNLCSYNKMMPEDVNKEAKDCRKKFSCPSHSTSQFLVYSNYEDPSLVA